MAQLFFQEAGWDEGWQGVKIPGVAVHISYPNLRSSNNSSQKEPGLPWAWADCKKADHLHLPRLFTSNTFKLQVLSIVHFFNRYSYIIYKIGGKFLRESRLEKTIGYTWVIFSCSECQHLQNHAIFRKDYFQFGRDLLTELKSFLQIINQIIR